MYAMRDALAALLREVDARCNGRTEGNSPLSAAADRARELLTSTRREFFVVVTECDYDKKRAERDPEYATDDRGPIVFECYLNQATTPENAEKHARNLGDKYGWVRVGRLIVEDWPESTEITHPLQSQHQRKHLHER